MRKIWISALAVSAICLAMTGCSSADSPDKKAGTTTTTTSTTAAKSADGSVNFLTGLPDMEGGDNRPVAIMIANDSSTYSSQYGIEEADMLVEGETEGGITRLMAVYSDVSRVPDTVGPVRSARSPFVNLAEALDAIYCHCGGSPGGLSTLADSGLADIDGQKYDGGYGNENGNTYWRDTGLADSIGYDHSMLTSGKNLAAHISNQEFRTVGQNPAPFTFGNKTGDQPATQMQIYLSAAQTISFKYDADDGLYYKRNGTLENGTAHETASGVPISATNVIVMYDSRYAEQTSTWGAAIYGYGMSGGSGKLASGGTARSIQWSRSSNGLSFTETDGTPLSVGKGKTYLCFVYSGYAEDTIVR